MITYILNAQPKNWEIRGLSTDEKPVNDDIGNGSTFFEMDTSKVFMFDKNAGVWREI